MSNDVTTTQHYKYQMSAMTITSGLGITNKTKMKVFCLLAVVGIVCAVQQRGKCKCQLLDFTEIDRLFSSGHFPSIIEIVPQTIKILP